MPAIAVVVFLFSLAAPVQSSGSRAPMDCPTWEQCQTMAFAAYDRQEFERFHDLAWRAIQLGPPRNPALMFLLARAQSLSGRPDDAAVMLHRLAEQGVAVDAATNPDFQAVRELASWPDLQRLILIVAASSGGPEVSWDLAGHVVHVPPSRGSKGGRAATGRASRAKAPDAGVSSSAEASAAASAAPTASASAAPVSEPASAPATPASAEPEVASAAAPSAVPGTSAATAGILTVKEALRLPSAPIVPAGLAYDRVSERFVVADRAGRRLVIADERSRHVVDLVNADSAGFHDITGLEIDWRRGDLWVVSVDDPGNGVAPSSTLHKLQLVSGRPLEVLPLPRDFGAARFVDVSVSPGGTVYALDALGGRIFALEPGSKRFVVRCVLAMTHATTIAVADDRTIYVAHATGLMRADAVTGSAQLVRNGPEPALLGLEHLRWARDALVGIAHLPDGKRQAVSISLVDGGLRVARVDVLDSDVALAGPDAVTLSAEGVLYFLTKELDASGYSSLVVRSIKTR